MALQTSGKISVQDILTEMGYIQRSIGLNELAQFWYYRTRKSKFNTSTHKLSDWYGESWGNYGYAYSASNSTVTFNPSIGTL